jgi:hypothetical protein
MEEPQNFTYRNLKPLFPGNFAKSSTLYTYPAWTFGGRKFGEESKPPIVSPDYFTIYVLAATRTGLLGILPLDVSQRGTARCDFFLANVMACLAVLSTGRDRQPRSGL